MSLQLSLPDTCPIHEGELAPCADDGRVTCAVCLIIHAAILAELPRTVPRRVRRRISAAATERRAMARAS